MLVERPEIAEPASRDNGSDSRRFGLSNGQSTERVGRHLGHQSEAPLVPRLRLLGRDDHPADQLDLVLGLQRWEWIGRLERLEPVEPVPGEERDRIDLRVWRVLMVDLAIPVGLI